jgi:2-keto-4-pentenoate hydratase
MPPRPPNSLADITAAQEALWVARENRQPLSPHGDAMRGLGLEDAREVARRLYARIISNGDRCIGWKIGATDPAAQRQLGLPGPLSAPLFASRCLQSGAPVWLPDLMAPRIEAEFGFCGPADQLQLCPLIEIADTRLVDWPSDGALTIADYCLQSHIVVGDPVTVVPATPLTSVRLSCDGDVVESAGPVTPPDHDLVMSLRPDEAVRVREPIVASGALTKAHLLRPGLWIAEFQGLGPVSVRVEE